MSARLDSNDRFSSLFAENHASQRAIHAFSGVGKLHYGFILMANFVEKHFKKKQKKIVRYEFAIQENATPLLTDPLQSAAPLGILSIYTSVLNSAKQNTHNIVAIYATTNNAKNRLTWLHWPLFFVSYYILATAVIIHSLNANRKNLFAGKFNKFLMRHMPFIWRPGRLLSGWQADTIFHVLLSSLPCHVFYYRIYTMHRWQDTRVSS